MQMQIIHFKHKFKIKSCFFATIGLLPPFLMRAGLTIFFNKKLTLASEFGVDLFYSLLGIIMTNTY